jgi:hypothetical protein
MKEVARIVAPHVRLVKEQADPGDQQLLKLA